jgi:hypothetical protein
MPPTTPSVRAVVARHAEATADNRVFFHPDIPEHRLASALTAYPGIASDDVLVLLDNTETGSATEGLLLTEDAIHACNSAGLVQRLPMEKLGTVELVPEPPPLLRLNSIAVLGGIRVRPATMERFVAMLREITGPIPDSTPTSCNPQEECGGEADKPVIRPVLWNPSAAVVLSAFFSPVFGALLHGLNWWTLGERQRFRRSLLWVIPGIALPFVSAFPLPLWAAIAAGLGYFAAWYLLAGRAQVRHVKEALPQGYVPRPWLGPSICCLVGVALMAFAIGKVAVRDTDSADSLRRLSTEYGRSLPTNQEMLERAAVDLVTKILARNTDMYSHAPKCLRVEVTEEIVDGYYRGTATLDNGTDIPLTIQQEFDGTVTVRLSL